MIWTSSCNVYCTIAWKFQGLQNDRSLDCFNSILDSFKWFMKHFKSTIFQHYVSCIWTICYLLQGAVFCRGGWRRIDCGAGLGRWLDLAGLHLLRASKEGQQSSLLLHHPSEGTAGGRSQQRHHIRRLRRWRYSRQKEAPIIVDGILLVRRTVMVLLKKLLFMWPRSAGQNEALIVVNVFCWLG